MQKCLIVIFTSIIMLLTACGGGSSDATPVDAAAPSTDAGITESDSSTDAPDSEIVVSVDEDGTTIVDPSALALALEQLPVGEITDLELEGLLLMREEEKLAGDVYAALYDLHALNVFDNISASEQTHTAAMLTLLQRYAIDDPVADNPPGVFTNPDMQVLYDALVSLGTPSLMDALFVGAKIEELDIADIERLKLDVEANDDIVLVYDNLLMGSRNHLRAFNKQITNNGWTYTPEYITQAQYDDIVNSDMERGGIGS